MKHIPPGLLLRALRRVGGSPHFSVRDAVMARSAKASARVTAAGQEATAANRESGNVSRAKAIGSGALDSARRQFQKAQAAAVQAHVRSQGQRQQARRDAR